MVREGYKQTEVGVIPENWEVYPLAKLASQPIQNGVFTNPLRKGRGCKLINVGDLYSSIPINLENLEFFDADQSEIKRFGVFQGDVFFTRSSLTPDGIAHCNICEGSESNVVFDCHLIRFRPNMDIIVPAFFFRYCVTAAARKYLVTHSKTTTMTTIDQGVISKLPIPLPPLSEQRSLAQALSDVDALIAALEKAIAKKRHLKTATMQQLLTGKKRLPGFDEGKSYKKTEIGIIPEDWRVDKVGDLASITTGSRNTQDRVEDGRYPFFVRSQTVERINSYSFDGEAVLTAGDGVGTGKIFHYINGKFDIHQRVYKISHFTPELNGFFFYKYFSNHFYDRIMSMTAKSSVDSVRMEMIAGMLVPLPEPEEQHAIATVLSDMDAEIAALETRRAKNQAIKQGMMQALLTGRVRLV